MAINPAPVIRRVISYPTPVISDVIFYEMRESRLPMHQNPPEYGAPHPDVNKYPKHKLVHITAADEGGWQRWYYAADRTIEEQDIYNFSLRDGEEFTRTYVVPRNAIPIPPDGGTPAPGYEDYAFAGQTIRAAEDPLAGLYSIVVHRYILGTTVSVDYDSRLDCMVRTTKMVVKRGGFVVEDGASYTAWKPRVEGGLVIELQPGNATYDVLIKQEVILPTGATGLSWTLPSIPSFVDYKFPPRLDAVKLIHAWALVTGAQNDYAEDFYFDFKITEAKPGPYEASIRRYVTANPAAITGTLNLHVVPSPIRETFGIAYDWFTLSPAKATAYAREIAIPSTIHNAITIEITNAPSAISNRNAYTKTTLAATPGMPTSGNFSSVNFPNGIDVEATVRQLSLGMYEVSVTNVKLPATGVYSII
jgi:hypothetical protein